jgi:hypothetical protein
MLSEIKRERSKKGMTGLEKEEINTGPFNRIRLELLHDRQTEIESGQSLN